MNTVLEIKSFKLVDDPEVLDADGYPEIVSVVMDLSDSRRVSCDPDNFSLAKTLTTTGAVFTDATACDEEDAGWLSWAKGVASEVAAPTVSTSMEELTGDLSGDEDEDEVVESEVGEGSEVEVGAGGTEVAPETEKPKLKRAGCKKPWEVKGWQEGKLLSCVKRHRGEWGKCEYRVLCLAEGRYRLVYFQGNREDLTIQTEWADAASMFRSLLAQGADKTRYDARGKRQGHRMTINQFFGKRKKRAPKSDTSETTK